MVVVVESVTITMRGALGWLRKAPSYEVFIAAGNKSSVKVNVKNRKNCHIGLAYETEEENPVVFLMVKKDSFCIPVLIGSSVNRVDGDKYYADVCIKTDVGSYFSYFERRNGNINPITRFSSASSIAGDASTRVMYNGETYTANIETMDTTDYAPILTLEEVAVAHARAKAKKPPTSIEKTYEDQNYTRKIRKLRGSPEMFIPIFSHSSMDIERPYILETLYAMYRIPHLKKTLRRKIMIRFIGELGEDHGALRKEFFEIAASKMVQDTRFCIENGLFDFTPTLDLENIRRGSAEKKVLDVEDDDFYSFVGFFLGHVVFQQVQIEVRFTKTFCSAILKRECREDDIEDVNIATSIQWIRENDVTDAGLYFNGKEQVTNENKERFIKDVVQNELYQKRGGYPRMTKCFHTFVTCEVLSFTPKELSRLISGVERVPMEYLKTTAIYKKCTSATREVVFFWEIMEEESEKFRKEMLKFITGSSSIQHLPGSLNEAIVIERVDKQGSLPTAHACFRRLVLYSYSTKQELKEKLLYALSEGSGFHFV